MNDLHTPALRIAAEVPTNQPTKEISGRLLSGAVAVGDTVMISPNNQGAGVEAVDELADGLRLTLDREVQLVPNAMISHDHNMPIETDVFLIEFDTGPSGTLTIGQNLEAEFATGRTGVSVQSAKIRERTGTLTGATLRASRILALDSHAQNPTTGTVKLLLDDVEIASGRISMEGYADQRELLTRRATNITRVDHPVSADRRNERHGHQGAVIWLTGLSGSGKSTLAVELEKALFDRHYQVYVLDGDNVRHGLNANLGFSPEDRSENIRRVGEVAALFSRAGLIAVSAFISPYRSDRERARAAAGDAFHEIYVSADLRVCEERDPKGLYKRARAGEIADFTGITAPYEVPQKADLIVDTATLDVAKSVAMIVDYVERVTVWKTN